MISHKDLQAKKKTFRMYDAILSGADGGTPPQFDPEMDKFMPMLTDYLKSEAMSNIMPNGCVFTPIKSMTCHLRLLLLLQAPPLSLRLRLIPMQILEMKTMSGMFFTKDRPN